MYDPTFRLLGREMAVKRRLVRQAHIGPGNLVLDLGCGTATLTILIKETYPKAKVSGLDGDPQVLKMALKKFTKTGIDLNLVRGMAFELPFDDESFECVFASLVIHHLSESNKVRTFAEVLRVLKPGGELHIAEFGKPHSLPMYLISLFMRRIEATTKIIKGLLPEMLNQAGFEQAKETTRFATMLGTISLYRARKPLSTRQTETKKGEAVPS